MKKALVLLGSVFMAGCFICHKTRPVEEVKVAEIVEQQAPIQEEQVITRYSILQAANFDFDSREIREDMNRMDELKQDIAANPQAVILVEGHTDNVGPEEYNKRLSVDRAKTVADVLAQQGYPNSIRIYGAGSSAPIASNDTVEGRMQNRRVDVVLFREDIQE